MLGRIARALKQHKACDGEDANGTFEYASDTSSCRLVLLGHQDLQEALALQSPSTDPLITGPQTSLAVS